MTYLSSLYTMSNFCLVELILIVIITCFSHISESAQLEDNMFSIVGKAKVLPNIQTNRKAQIGLKKRKKRSYVADNSPIFEIAENHDLNDQHKAMIDSFFQSRNGQPIYKKENFVHNTTFKQGVAANKSIKVKVKSPMEKHNVNSTNNGAEFNGKSTNFLFRYDVPTVRRSNHFRNKQWIRKCHRGKNSTMRLPKKFWQQTKKINGLRPSQIYKRRNFPCNENFRRLNCKRRYSNDKCNYLICNFESNNLKQEKNNNNTYDLSAADAGVKNPGFDAALNSWKKEVNWIKCLDQCRVNSTEKGKPRDVSSVTTHSMLEPVRCQCPVGYKCLPMETGIQSVIIGPSSSSPLSKTLSYNEDSRMTTRSNRGMVTGPCFCGCKGLVAPSPPVANHTLSKL